MIEKQRRKGRTRVRMSYYHVIIMIILSRMSIIERWAKVIQHILVREFQQENIS